MNKNQTQIQFEPEQRTNKSLTPLQRVREFVRNNLVGTITLTIGGSLLLTGTSTWNMWNIYSGFQSTVTKQVELQKNNGKIAHIGEVLGLSAKLSASTGDPQWEKNYHQLEPELDRLIKDVLANVTPAIRAEAGKSDKDNQALVALEAQSFKLVQQGKAPEALKLLMGQEYTSIESSYIKANDLVLGMIEKSISQQLKDYEQQLLIAILIAGGTLPILIASWILVLSAVRDYIRDRQTAQTSLQQSQRSLSSLNEALQTESEVRRQQETTVRSDSERLQQDISELLDVVCEIESGDFTVQAQVNNRATGLVGDTLNRLVETLARVISQVSTSAQRVAVNSSRQDKIAAAVADSTSEQTASVQQVLALTETVRESANIAAAQLQDTYQSMIMLQSTVTDGEMTIGSLDREIDVLQQGSDRIVQQMKTLGEFVGLADRFVFDQSDIATQTQILALNASLVAARAAEQRDPKQFESVAREFESIASQVSQLAQQTNEGLTSLEQRNNQIHRVVSDVDGEVQRLGGLVNSFTQGVKQTRAVFATVQSVTGQVVTAGEVVSQTSQTIIDSADSTAKSIAAIATLSAQIDEQSQSARSISTQMSNLSAELLGNVQIFKLPAQSSPATVAVLPPVIPTLIVEPETDLAVAIELDYQLN
jgi:methyl-accepting chemotaxis protein PixJ